MSRSILYITLILGAAAQSRAAEVPAGRWHTSSIGIKFVRIEPGSFMMGQEKGGDWDERPGHKVAITRPFYMATTEVTNAQYEQFDPSHKQLRGRRGHSRDDDEAVVFVSWHDAVGFCRWLSAKEGLPYRLPTEAEWEYACRAGSTTDFYCGNVLSEALQRQGSGVSLGVGKTAPNAWGLYDMHGNVEEWCLDWYGAYESSSQIDPVGRVDGDFKVTRGGSHSTEAHYLRSANRSGSIPEDRQWMIGFRVALGGMPKTEPLANPAPEQYQRGVRQEVPCDIARGPDPNRPYFRGPRLVVKIPEGSRGPLFSRHNHFMAVTECANGDLLAAWFTCLDEMGRELGVAASRLRYGHEEWEQASPFWDAPDRNDHAHALWHDGKGTIYHFNGLGANVRSLALLLRKSRDNGVTWSKARPIFPDHDRRHNTVVESVFRAQGGEIIVPSDGRGGSVIAISYDEGRTWVDPGGKIRGIHGAVAQLRDGRLLAFGRKGAIDGKMPMSISSDMGASWEYLPSEFQPVNLGQRAVLMRLKEGPLFFASFCKKMLITDASGGRRPVSGLFGAVSLDEGETWAYRRLITDDGPGRIIETMDAHPVTMDAHDAEYVGYLSVCQSADGVIHLLSSRQHYAFNLKWLMTPPSPAAAKPPPTARRLPLRHNLPNIYKPKGLPSEDRWGWSFRGAGLKETDATRGSSEGLLRIHTGDGQQLWWRSEKPDVFGGVEQERGFTAEIKCRVLNSTRNGRGLDLELYDGAGSRYAMTITENGVYWYEGLVLGSVFLEFDQFTPVAEGLDNTDAMHTYRLAVRADRVVQIYRDGKLLGVRRYEYRTPRDAYILFGAGPGLEALVDYVGYDLSGPSCP